ncbi:MAG TPA: 2-C-methyl-D-erythritol 4-phosphate cytidylyltransferase [Gemmatimonadales bacterium]|nr:2-C-methyl-D-erythritol 4-phosphate cytidylyltransferase [Gemmatimonadales bacterium]
MPRDVGVLVVAAGVGQRVGGGVLKQYREIGGVPMLLRALRPFVSHPKVKHVVVALPATHAAAPPEWLAALAGKALSFVAGGVERHSSVQKALAALDPACHIVLVHDAARPFVERATIDAVIAVARAGTGAVAAVPVSDTLKEAGHDRRVRRTVPRDELWRAQTPQGFPRELLQRAHDAAGAGADATDDAILVERLGEPVHVVPDSAANFKVTTAEDLALAEAWAATMPSR